VPPGDALDSTTPADTPSRISFIISHKEGKKKVDRFTAMILASESSGSRAEPGCHTLFPLPPLAWWKSKHRQRHGFLGPWPAGKAVYHLGTITCNQVINCLLAAAQHKRRAGDGFG
jgi:hypothetical protein